MKAISLFSGVGGFDLGFERAGIETVLQAERDPWCLKVLERHWPQTERVSDVRMVGRCADGGRESDVRLRGGSGLSFGESAGRTQDFGPFAATDHGWREARTGIPNGIDLIYGGFPCQDLSVAGKRAGLGGDRSGLWFEFRRIVDEIRPRWVCIENVPGLLSSNQGRDFGIVLNGLDELGYGVAWNILDAQFFGVPQRRRRVFIVGCLGDERSAAAVLSVCESCGGDTEAGREAGERVAATIRGRSASPGVNMPGRGGEDDDNLITAIQDVRGVRDKKQNGIGIAQGEPMYTLDGTSQHGVHIASPLTASAGHHGHSLDRGDGSSNLVAALTASGRGTERVGESRGQDPLVLVDHDTYIPTIVGALSDGAHHGGGLNGQDAHTGRVIAPSNGVRRLTPLECQRLQGFPDWWYDGLDLANSHIYRQMGNAVCVPVAEYIGHRIVALGD